MLAIRLDLTDAVTEEMADDPVIGEASLVMVIVENILVEDTVVDGIDGVVMEEGTAVVEMVEDEDEC